MADDNVEVKFSANTSDLETGVGEAKEQINSISESTSSFVESLSGIAEAIAAAFTIDKIAEFVKGTADAAEQLERLKTITGLSTDTIQNLQFAMELTGGDAEAAGASLTRFSRSINEATTGTGNAYAAFGRLGVSLDDLKHKSSQAIFDEMLEGLRNIQDESERTDIAWALMGRGAAALIPVLAKGKEGLEDIGIQADKTGKKLSPEMTEKFDQLAKDITIMKDSIIGLGRVILENFVKPIDTAIVEVTKLVQALQSWKSFTDYLAQGNKGQQVYLGNEVAGPNQEKSSASAKINRTPLSDDTKKDDTKNDESAQRTLYAEKYATKKEFDDLEVQSGKITHAQEFADLRNALSEEHAAIQESFDREAQLYDNDSDEYKKLMDKKLIADQKYQIESMKITQEETKNDQKEWLKVADTINKSLDTMLSGVLQGTQTIGQAFANMAENMVIAFIEAIAKMLVQWAVFEAATAAGFKVGSSGGGGAGGFILGSIGSLIGLDNGAWNVQEGLYHLHNDEMVVPKPFAEAVRSGEGGGFGGGGDTHLHVHAMDSRDVKRFFNQHGPAIAKTLSGQARSGNRSFFQHA